MALEDKFKQQAVVLDLLEAAGIAGKQRATYEATLTTPLTIRLFTAEADLTPVKQKLAGKRVKLTESQENIAVLVRHLHDFEQSVGAWLATRPTQPYAVEYVLAHYDIKKKDFTDAGTATALLNKVDFNGLQTLRRHSRFEGELRKLYGSVSNGTVDYTAKAEDVSKKIIGRIMVVPSTALTTAFAVNEWKAFKAGKGNTYQPIHATIIETEGFETDSAVTRSRYCMLAAPGQIDIMPNRGHTLLNIGTRNTEVPSCVMVRAIVIEGKAIEGPGKVSEALFDQNLVGQVLGVDIPVEGYTAPSGYVPASAAFSTGKYRMQ